MSKAPGNYDDIIHHDRPIIANHPPLSLEQRAAQFAPFKTITLYHDSTDDIEAHSDQPETEIIWDEEYLNSDTDFAA